MRTDHGSASFIGFSDDRIGFFLGVSIRNPPKVFVRLVSVGFDIIAKWLDLFCGQILGIAEVIIHRGEFLDIVVCQDIEDVADIARTYRFDGGIGFLNEETFDHAHGGDFRLQMIFDCADKVIVSLFFFEDEF